MARFGKSAVTEEPTAVEDHSELGVPLDENNQQIIEDHSETTYDTQIPGVPADYNQEDGMTNIIDDAPAVPAESVPEVPSVVVNHDADVVDMPVKPKRGRPKLGQLPPMTAEGILADEEVSPEEWETMPVAESAATERDAWQIKMDARVTKVHDAWVKAGKPNLRTAPRLRLTVKPELKATTRKMLTRSGAYLKLRVHIYQTVHNADGTVSIVYTAVDRPPSEKKSDKK